jgi:hypothetical protein
MNEGEEFESLLPLSYRPQSARHTNQASKPARDVFAVQANDVANRLVRVMVDAVRNLRAASCDSAQEERRLRLEPSMRQGSRVRKNRRVEVEEIIDRLYSLPLAEFTTARNDAERELRKAGQKKQAARVKALRKPTAAASAVNRLVRAHRGEVDEFFGAAATLRNAQFAGKGDLAAATQAERDALERLVSLGGEAVRPTLQAAAVDEKTAREVLEARLVREPEPAGFGTMLAHAEPAPTSSAATRGGTARHRKAEPARPDDSAARKRLQEAEQALKAAAAEERQARRRWEQTQGELEKAQAAVGKARAELDRLRAR